MNQTTINILNQVFSIYNGSIVNLESGSIQIAKEIFNAVVLISIAIFGFNLLLRKNQDLSDTHIELVKQLIYLIFLYAFINNFGTILTTIYSWINDTGNYLGNKASLASINTPVMSISPVNIFGIGVDVAKKMLTIPVSWNIFNDILVAFFAVISAAAVLFCFAVIGLELILVQIGGKIILAGGIFLLGFAGLPWAREYAERYIHTFFHVGIKMIFIYMLVGIGMSLSQNWVTVLGQANKDKIIETYMAVAVASYVYYKLCTKLPDQAVSWLTGRISMGFETASDVKGAIKTVAAAPAAVKSMAIKMAAGAAGIQGMNKAVAAAGQVAKAKLDSEGKEANSLNTGMETIKTLGAAQKVEWDKKVDGTKGGKLAQNVLDTIPKPKKDKNQKGQEGP